MSDMENVGAILVRMTSGLRGGGGQGASVLVTRSASTLTGRPKR